MTTLTDLPVELIILILSRLNPKSVANCAKIQCQRLRVICKDHLNYRRIKIDDNFRSEHITFFEKAKYPIDVTISCLPIQMCSRDFKKQFKALSQKGHMSVSRIKFKKCHRAEILRIMEFMVSIACTDIEELVFKECGFERALGQLQKNFTVKSLKLLNCNLLKRNRMFVKTLTTVKPGLEKLYISGDSEAIYQLPFWRCNLTEVTLFCREEVNDRRKISWIEPDKIQRLLRLAKLKKLVMQSTSLLYENETAKDLLDWTVSGNPEISVFNIRSWDESAYRHADDDIWPIIAAFSNLQRISLSHLNITKVTIRKILQRLSFVEDLEVSNCCLITKSEGNKYREMFRNKCVIIWHPSIRN